ncbi:hypothetical protein [Novosphingobium soli]|uniref:UrcA family protein n=1 Tax=Novosphingobium soli TaxID=574956 RepID=A0ABV6CYL1_9SPHN
MSLLALAALAAAVAVPDHTVTVEHRGSSYKVDYRASVKAKARTIGMAAGARPSTQRCLMTAVVSVDRVIADGDHKLAAAVPGEKTFTRNLPGHCRGRDGQLAALVAEKSPAIRAHLVEAAAADRPQALAAIEAAHHFAAN